MDPARWFNIRLLCALTAARFNFLTDWKESSISRLPKMWALLAACEVFYLHNIIATSFHCLLGLFLSAASFISTWRKGNGIHLKNYGVHGSIKYLVAIGVRWTWISGIYMNDGRANEAVAVVQVFRCWWTNMNDAFRVFRAFYVNEVVATNFHNF